jgi:glutamyl-tRNA synthetase
MIRVRIAPSPTGFAHVGTAYTALFNYAFARRNKGKFILRIEDTDIKRNVIEAERKIFDGLAWLGIEWDEGPNKGGRYGPYKQSERLDIYREKAKELIKKGLAYEEEGAIRYKNLGEDVGWRDLVRGEISFPGSEIGDFVIMKSDGYPTYNFAVVVDDSLMKISHIIRAEEHISNTPRQIALYRALGLKIPEFAHLPLLRNPDRSKISKRKNPVALSWYREQGYLPEALINFLCLLGWSHPEGKEIFSLEEFIKVFDIKRVRKAGPIFNLKKLDWINGEYIRKSQNSKLKTQIYEFFDKKYPEKEVGKIVPLIKERIKTLKEFQDLAGFFFKKPKVDKGLLGSNYQAHLKAAIEALEKDEPLKDIPEKKGFKTGDFFMDLRVAITGSRVTPPINESIRILGKKETLERLKKIVS